MCPAMLVLLRNWTPEHEKTKVVSIVFAGATFGTIIANPVTGLLCDYGFDGGWPSVLYVFGKTSYS